MIDATSWHLNNFNQLAAVVAGIAETGIEESSMVAGVRKSPKRCGVDRAKDQVHWNRIKFKRKQTQPERVCGQYVDPSRQTSQGDLIQNSLTRKGGLSWIKSWKTTYFRIVTGRLENESRRRAPTWTHILATPLSSCFVSRVVSTSYWRLAPALVALAPAPMAP
jgi:hypothetical protein